MLISTLCFGVSVVGCCSFADRLGQRLGVIDHPDGVRKHHARPTPLVGGIALMLPLFLIAWREAFAHPAMAALFWVLGAAGLAFMALGCYDDRHHIAPVHRLLISTLLCSAFLLVEPRLVLVQLDLGFGPMPLGWLAIPFTILCLVGLQNAINMADGMNGLVIGLSIFWTACLLIYAPDDLSLFLSCLLLGLLILLPYNLMGYLFLGDAGSYSLGVIIGLLMIYVHHTAPVELPMLTVVLWLLVPVVDCLRIMATRLASGSSPLAPDRNHLHHRLARHWPWPVSVMIYLAVATLPGLAAALQPELTPPMLALAAIAYSSVIWITRPRRVVAAEHNAPVSS